MPRGSPLPSSTPAPRHPRAFGGALRSSLPEASGAASPRSARHKFTAGGRGEGQITTERQKRRGPAGTLKGAHPTVPRAPNRDRAGLQGSGTGRRAPQKLDLSALPRTRQASLGCEWQSRCLPGSLPGSPGLQAAFNFELPARHPRIGVQPGHSGPGGWGWLSLGAGGPRRREEGERWRGSSAAGPGLR